MASLERLKQVIDIYGGESVRWPEAERAALMALAARTPEIALARREARALDAVLAMAPGADESRLSDLRQRILAGAGLDDTAPAVGGAAVSPITVGPRRNAPRPLPMWAAAAALAASLFVGVAIGASDFGRPAVEELAGIAGIETTNTNVGTLDVLDDSDVELL